MTEHSQIPLTEATTGSACGCGEHDADLPVLDARAIPHSIRHATIFGALSAVKPGKAIVLIAPHNPLPLLKQIQDREGGAIEVSYLVEGHEDWHLKLARVS